MDHRCGVLTIPLRSYLSHVTHVSHVTPLFIWDTKIGPPVVLRTIMGEFVDRILLFH
mgnify:CR=1 FL=1